MAKFAGMPVTISVDNVGGSPVDVSNSIMTIGYKGSVGEQIVTGADKTAQERLQLLEDFELTLAGKGIPPSAHRAVLWEDLQTSRTVTIDFPDSATVTAEVFFFGLDINRGDDAGADWSLSTKLNNGTAPAWS